MPRTSRFSVEFEIPGNSNTWIAKFIHNHTKTDDQGNPIGITHVLHGKAVLGQHLTTCVLSYKNGGPQLRGFSLCSFSDAYNWKKGIKQSLQRALAKGGFCREVLESYDEVVDGEVRTVKKGTFLPLRSEYGEVMRAFYRELPIKKYSVDAQVTIPLQNQHGLGYAGAD